MDRRVASIMRSLFCSQDVSGTPHMFIWGLRLIQLVNLVILLRDDVLAVANHPAQFRYFNMSLFNLDM